MLGTMNVLTYLQSATLKIQSLNLFKYIPKLSQHIGASQKLFYHGLANPAINHCLPAFVWSQNTMPNQCKSSLLSVQSVTLVPACGFKVKGRLKRRCKDCYFVMRQERLYVICKTHPRHKQMSIKAPEKRTWILTHATQSRVRPW